MIAQVSYDMMIEAIEENNISKLETALSFGNPNYVKGNALFDRFCEIGDKKTPLQFACYKGDYDMVKLLINNGADVNYTKMNAIYSPLIWAIKGKSEKDIEIVKYLVENGADVNYSCNVERPVISWLVDSKTISKNGFEILKYLVSSGADPRKLNYLNDACYWKHNDMIVYFVEQCDYSVKGGDSIQQYCRGVNSFSQEIFELLILNGADIYERDRDGKSAIDYLLETTKGDIYWVDVMKSIYARQR